MGFEVPTRFNEVLWDLARLWAAGWAVQACTAPLTVQDVKAAVKELPAGECPCCPELPGSPEVGVSFQALVITLAVTASCCCAAGAGLTVLTGAAISRVRGVRNISDEASPRVTAAPAQLRGIRS